MSLSAPMATAMTGEAQSLPGLLSGSVPELLSAPLSFPGSCGVWEPFARSLCTHVTLTSPRPRVLGGTKCGCVYG